MSRYRNARGAARAIGRSCALAASALALGAGSAHAQAGSSGLVIGVGHSQAHGVDGTVLTTAVQSQSRGAGVNNAVDASAFEPTLESLSTHLNADARFGPGVFGSSLGVGMSNTLEIHNLAGQTDLSAFATMGTTDLVTLTGLAGDHRMVNFHSGFLVFTGSGAAGDIDFFDDSSDFSISALSTIRIDGAGIGPSALGNDIFEQFGLTADPHHQGRSSFAAPVFIPFDLTFALGSETPFNVQVTQQMDILMNDRRGTLDANLFVNDGLELLWEGFASVADAQTGQQLCGITINSASGVDYGSIAACPGGGGGGGAGGVPEPASWTLMIAGFGLAGASLRRCRLAA